MENKEFRFQGLDAKTEWKTALFLIIPALIIMFGVLYLSHIVIPKVFFLIPLVFAAFITVIISMIILKMISKRIKDKEWFVKINGNNEISIKYKDQQYNFGLKDIIMIKNMGNVGVRYLTIKTKNDILKIRVGNTGFAPFSQEKDITELDAFIGFIKPYLNENFNKKILKNAINTNIIPNFGIYVIKGEEIKYSILNKMKPWQVITMVLTFGVLIMILFFNIMEYYFFK